MIRALLAAALIGTAALPAHADDTLFQPGFKLVNVSERDLARPHDLVLSPDGFYLFVADLDNDEIRILEPGSLKNWSRFGKGELSAPHDVTFLDQETVLVADTANDRIAVYRFTGVRQSGEAVVELTTSWEDQISWPEGVAVAPQGGPVYVTNVGDGTVVKLDRSGKVLKAVGGDAPLNFNRPHDIAVAPDGRVFVADSANDRMVILSKDLDFISEHKGAPFNFDDPKYMAFDEAGDLWLADEYNSRVLRLSSDMEIKEVVGTGERGDGPGQLNWPEGVEAAGFFLWISDTYNNRIMLLRRLEP